MTKKEIDLREKACKYKDKAESCLQQALISILNRKGFSQEEIEHFSVSFVAGSEEVIAYNQEPIWDGGFNEIDGLSKADIEYAISPIQFDVRYDKS